MQLVILKQFNDINIIVFGQDIQQKITGWWSGDRPSFFFSKYSLTQERESVCVYFR